MATWLPLSGASRSVRSVQAQTEVGPPADGVGVNLLRVAWITTHLSAPAGQTFTGSGYLRAWLWDPVLGSWRRAPRADEDLVDGAGLASWAFPAKAVGSPRGLFAQLADGIGLSGVGGGQITIEMACTTWAGDIV